MKKWLIIGLLVCFSGAFAAGNCRVEKRDLPDNYTRYILYNDCMAVDVMPQLDAMISGVRYLPEKRELFPLQTINVEYDDLLPPSVVINGGGIRDFLWGVTTFGNLPFKVGKVESSADQVSLTMNNRWFRLQNLEAVKTITLKNGRTAFSVAVTLRNCGKKEFNAALWQNVNPHLGKDDSPDQVILPVRGGIKMVGNRGVKYFEKDQVYVENDLHDREVFAAPARPWLAVVNPDRPGVLVLRSTREVVGDGSLFYTYKTPQVHTMELIASSRKIAPGRSYTFLLDYVFFPGLTGISEVFGSEIALGVQAKLEKSAIALAFQSSGRYPAGEWKFFLTGKDGRSIAVGSQNIPELTPEKVFSFSLELPENIASGEYTLSGASGLAFFSVAEAFKIAGKEHHQTGIGKWSSSNPMRYSMTGFGNSLWYESFEQEGVLPFTVEYCGGAEGKVGIVSGSGRTGKRVLRTEKSNDQGYILIRFKKHIPVKNGEKLQFNAFYQGESNIPLYSRGMLRLQCAGQQNFKLFSFYPGINGGDRLQEIIVTSPGTWERKFTQRKAENDTGSFEPVLILAGAPSVALWDDFYIENDNISAENWNNFFNRREPLDRSGEMISDAELDQIVATEAEHTGEVRVIGGKSRLLIDGKITAPVIDGPYGAFVVGKTYSNVKDFGAKNIHLCKVGLRLGEGYPAKTYSGCWKGKDELDIAGAVEQIRNTLKLNPNARIILTIGLHPYHRFTRDFPEEAWIGKNGKPVYGTGIHIRESLEGTPSANCYIWPSYHSEVLISLYKEQISRIVDELKRNGLAKFIVGIHLGGGHDNQMVTTHFDYSLLAQRAFRKFLREKYVTVEALRQAWRDDTITFDTVEAPYFQSNDDCLHPETEQPQIDFFRFSKTAGWRMADKIAEYVREKMGKPVFTMRWCMGPYAGNPGASLDIYDFLTVQKFDILVAQSSYNLRTPSVPSTSLLPLDSFHLHGKLFTNEFDIRTWNAAPSWEKEIMSISWGLMLDFPMWQAANRKLAGAMFAKDMGFWYLDMAPGWFNHPQLLDDIGSVASAGEKLFALPPSKWQPDTAFVIDDDGMFLRNLPGPEWMFDMTALTQWQLQSLGASGVPFACYSLNDLMANPELAESFKVLVFSSMYHIDSRRQALLDRLKNGGRTLVFLSGTGRLGGAKSGSTIEVKAGKRAVNHRVKAKKGMPFTVLSPWMNKKDPHPQAVPAWYDSMRIVYAVAVDGDKVLARFEENNEAAILERDHADWKAVYIGESGGLAPDYFHSLVARAGAYHIGDSGFQCKTNGNFMMVHALKNGKITFKMPFEADVIDLASGKKYSGITGLPVDAEAGATYWFLLRPSL